MELEHIVIIVIIILVIALIYKDTDKISEHARGGLRSSGSRYSSTNSSKTNCGLDKNKKLPQCSCKITSNKNFPHCSCKITSNKNLSYCKKNKYY